MNEEVARVHASLAALRKRLLAGEIFAQLPGEIAALRQSVKRTPKTPVELPDEGAITRARMAGLYHDIHLNKTGKTEISDADLAWLIDHLGALEPTIRDKGVYFIVSDLFQDDSYTDTQLRWLFNRLQDPELLFSHILEPTNNAVFGRSFAIMILSGLVYADQDRYHVLTADDYSQLLLNFATYIMLETDGRGYVSRHGWAHSYTHIANLADELTEVKALPRGQKVFLMAVLIDGWQRMNDSLAYGEDQRVAAYLVNLANKHQFYADSLVLILTAWQDRVAKQQTQESIAFWNRWYNRSRLLETLLMRGDLPKRVSDYLAKLIDLY